MADDNAPNKPVDNRRPDGTFGPGNIANPSGRPPMGNSLTEVMREFLEGKPEGSTLSYKEAFIRKVYKLAMEDGSESAIRLIWNYIDGMPLQGIDVTSKGEKINPLVKIDTNDK